MALAEDGPASPGNSNHGLTLGVVMIDVKRRLTPFWTVTDNPTPFAVNDQITPPVTDWLSVSMCRERTGSS